MTDLSIHIQDGGEVKDDFSKGVVFYTKGGVVVGVLTWNIFGKMDLARKVLAAHAEEHISSPSVTRLCPSTPAGDCRPKVRE